MMASSQYSFISTDYPSTPPRSFVFYAIAKIDGTYRQLAVAQQLAMLSDLDGPYEGVDLVRSCVRVVSALAAPANRIAIQSELALAAAGYARQDLSSPRLCLLPWNSWKMDLEMDGRSRRMPWNKSLQRFPFLSTCLLLALSCDATHGIHYANVRNEPLGLMYSDDSLEYGMVVFDVSDLDRIRYGIVGFSVVHTLTSDPASPSVAEFVSMYGTVELDTMPLAEAIRPRRPLSATEYMVKFGYDAVDDYEKHCIQQLEKFTLVDVSALDGESCPCLRNYNPIYLVMYLTPKLTCSAACWRRDGQEPQNTLLPSPKQSTRFGPHSLQEQSIVRLVETMLDPLGSCQLPPLSQLRETTSVPNLQTTFRLQLLRCADQLCHSPMAADLLSLAFAGQAHLDWVLFSGIAVSDLGAALQRDELRGAKSISLCIDTINGTAQEIIQTIWQSSAVFSELHFHQKPDRRGDQESTEILSHILSAPKGKSLLQDCQVLLISGAFSAALRHEMWLPNNADLSPLFRSFPVQHIFVRSSKHASEQDEEDENPGAHRFWARYYYLADGLFPPERLASGFLAFLAALAVPESGTANPLPFLACAPSKLSDMSFRDNRPVCVGPLPAENYAIPFLPLRTGRMEKVECWPRVRTLVPGSWSVVVSVEDIPRGLSSNRPSRAIKSTVLRYAFVRPQVKVDVADAATSLSLGPADVEVVGGLADFVRHTAPHVSEATVESKLGDLESFVAGAGYQEPLDQTLGHRWVSVLEPVEARAMLSEFLLDAAVYGRKTLRLAMEERPDSKYHRRPAVLKWVR